MYVYTEQALNGNVLAATRTLIKLAIRYPPRILKCFDVMKIAVLCGSPKGAISTTLQYVLFLRNRFPEHDFEILDITYEYPKFERDEAAFQSILDSVGSADGLIWAFPVYTFLVHAHYKRFIELVLERGASGAFQGKYAAAISTSLRFFDHTAHNYIHAICDDWGSKYVGSFSAKVYDLVEPEGKKQLLLFGQNFFEAIEKRLPVDRAYDRVETSSFSHDPSPPQANIRLGRKSMVVLTDSEDDDSNIAKMVERFRACIDGQMEVINLHHISIQSACDGCFQCGANGECVYKESDDLHDLYMSKIVPADIIVMAGSIRDRYLSSRWKIFYDRGFFRPLIPWLPGKELGFIISGPLKQIPNLRQILEGYADYHQANLAGIVTDESEDSGQIDHLLETLAGRLNSWAREGYVQPRTFLGIGGTRIFRDDTWGFLRPVFQVAHRYYQKHGLYDFPQYSFKTRFIAVGGMLITQIPGIRQRFFRTVKSDLVKSLIKAAKE
jgi:multimeric flavodoxin WrbA